MPESNALLLELESAVAQGTPERRHAALSYATELMITGRYADEEIWVFGEIVGLLAAEIEAATRAQLAHRLAHVPKAPANIINRLASDDSIEVAGPVLRHCEQLSLRTLVEHAKTKGQDHLLAISQRKSLHEDVTDVLVSRGSTEVVRSVARNSGARFSDSGFWSLVQRCEDDVVLAADVGARKDIPRHQFQKLIAKASDEVKARLAEINPAAASDINDAVIDITGAFQAKFGPATRSYFAAKRAVGTMHRSGELTEAAIGRFARSRQFEEVTVALSLVCDMPVDVVERGLHDDHGEVALILCKAAKLSWETARLVLSMGAGSLSAHDLDKALKNYSLLSATTARQVLGFYRTRHAAASSGTNLLPALHGR